MVWTKWTKVETSLGLPERATAALADIRGFEPLAGRIVAGLGVEVGGLEVEFWHQLELRAGAPDRSLFYEFVVSHAIEDGLVYARLQSSGIELDHLPGQGRFPIWHDSPEVRSRKEGGYRPAGRDQVPDWDEKHAFLRRAMGPSIEAFLVGLRPIRAQA